MSSIALSLLYEDVTHNLTGLSELKWVDIDMGQFDKDGASYPMDYPAALIRFDNIIWKDINATKQIGLVHFTIKIAFRFYDGDHFARPTSTNVETQDLFSILSKVDVAMRNVRGTNYSIVKRFNDSLLATKPEEFLWIYVIEYQANVQSDDDDLEKPGIVDVDFIDIANNNLLLERKRLNVRRVDY